MFNYWHWILTIAFTFQMANAQVIFKEHFVIANGKIQKEVRQPEVPRPRVALVLSGGGARGIVHIGVLKALEQHHIPIDLIVGTSIGSVVGGLYASGYTPDEILKIMKKINWAEIYQDKTQRSALFWGQKGEQDRYLLNVRFKRWNPYIPVAISPGQRILMTLADLILRAHYQAIGNFDRLRIPFRAVTTDLVSGKTVVLKRGNLAEAINASSAIPLLFVPIEMDSMLLVDGGLRSNLPVHVARKEGAQCVIAVDVTSPLRKKEEIKAPWQIVDQATTIMADMERQLEKKDADVLIEPPLGEWRNDDYSQFENLVQLGFKETLKHIAQIQNSFKRWQQRNSRKFFIKNIEVNAPLLSTAQFKVLNSMRGQWLPLPQVGHFLKQLDGDGAWQTFTVQADTSVDSLNLVLNAVPFPEIKTINLTGVTRYKVSTLKDLMFSRPGMPLNMRYLQEDLKILTDFYRAAGYSLMAVDSIGWDGQAGILTLHINEGLITDIRIVGNKKVRRYVIAREFGRQKGRVFNWRGVQQAIGNAYATQLFERVTVDIVQENTGYVLVVKVKEKSTVVLRIGGKYDTDRKAQMYLEFGDECLLGMGIKSMLVGRFGMRDGKIGFKIRDDRIFTTYLTFDLQTYYKWQINPFSNGDGTRGTYREIRKGATFQVGQQLKRLGQFVFELRHENIEDRAEHGPFRMPQNIELRTFAVRAMTDKRDRIDFPNRGINNYWSWESGNRLLLGSKESYTKILVNLEGFYTFKNRVTWHVRTFFGVGDRSMPFSENFRLGGMHEFYGLYENEYYGRQLFIASAEYRVRLPFKPPAGSMLFRNFYLSLRYDFGGIWENPNLVFSSEDFFSGIGGYLGIDTILGPLYFAVGHLTTGRTIGYISIGFNY